METFICFIHCVDFMNWNANSFTRNINHIELKGKLFVVMRGNIFEIEKHEDDNWKKKERKEKHFASGWAKVTCHHVLQDYEQDFAFISGTWLCDSLGLLISRRYFLLLLSDTVFRVGMCVSGSPPICLKSFPIRNPKRKVKRKL